MPKSGISRNCGHILRAANSYTLPDQVNGKLAHREIVNWLKVKGKSEGVAKHHCSEVMWSKKEEYFEKLRENNAATNRRVYQSLRLQEQHPSHMEMKKQFQKELDSK